VARNVAEATTYAYAAGISATNVAVTDSTIADNSARATADGGEAYGGGLLVEGGRVDASTISGNTATSPTFAHGGGVLHFVTGSFGKPDASTPVLTLTNTTVAANTADSAVRDSVGGGLEETSAWSTSLVFSTVSGNRAAQGANVAAGASPGPVVGGPKTATVFASVLADPLGGGVDCGPGLTIVDAGSNAATDDSCGFAASAAPQLGALGDNGGPTFTMLPSKTSPLLDQVASAACLAHVASDPRGLTRPQGAACDIGAVEVAVEVPPVIPIAPTTPVPAGPLAAPAAIGVTPRFTG
jgi:hypothetical protein